jgi:hypothetical protein
MAISGELLNKKPPEASAEWGLTNYTNSIEKENYERKRPATARGCHRQFFKSFN